MIVVSHCGEVVYPTEELAVEIRTTKIDLAKVVS
jgi:hypothetical protein